MIYFLSIIALAALSLAIHEAGHWAVLRRANIPLTKAALGMGPLLWSRGMFEVRLFWVGASVTPEARAFETAAPGVRMLAALGGPWFSAMYASLLGFCAAHLEGPGSQALAAMAQFNWMLAATNLVPLPPLDGWHVLMAAAEKAGHRPGPFAHEILTRLGSGVLHALVVYAVMRSFGALP